MSAVGRCRSTRVPFIASQYAIDYFAFLADGISPRTGSDVKSEMHRYKKGKAKKGRGGKGGKVKSRKQAIAIGLSKARKKGKKVPKKKES
jgi:hypothetical protein